MHPIDRGASVALRLLPRSERVFADGWGDPSLLGLLDAASLDEPAPIAPDWERSWMEDGVRLRHGCFRSPVPHLPAAAQEVIVLGVEPEQQPSQMCLLLPAWNDEGFRTRRRIAAGLARHGIGSLMLEAALYGTRRRFHARTPVRTVSDFVLMTHAVVAEARSLLAWLRSAGFSPGVAGYSMGGSLAAVVGATMPEPVALAPLAAAHAPNAVFVDGVLRASVAWAALGNDGRHRLATQLARASVVRLPPAPSTRSAVLVGATWDGFVPREATAAIHRHWPGSELRWIRAGHATLLWRRMDALVAAIVRAFDRTFGGGAASSGAQAS